MSQCVTNRTPEIDDASADMESLTRLMARFNALVQELPDLLGAALPDAVGLAEELAGLTTYQETVQDLGYVPWEATA